MPEMLTQASSLGKCRPMYVVRVAVSQSKRVGMGLKGIKMK